MSQHSGQQMSRTSRICRGGIALVVAYVFAIQAMLFGLVGAQFANSPYDHASAGFELCLNGFQDNSGLPTGPTAPHHLDHCTLCFAGTHHFAAGETSPSHADYVNRTRGVPLTTAANHRPRYAWAYSIARPRGPPISA